MRISLHITSIVAICALGVILAGCTQTSQSAFSTIGTPGVTDEPAAGFRKVKPGSEEDYIMAVGRRVYFASGSSDLDDVARETLDLQATWLKKYPKWLIKMQGHSDDSRSNAKNVVLSDKRAKVVMDYFAKQGVDQRRMWVKGYGNERLVRNCKELECKALNRRVVVNLRANYDAAAPQYKKAG